MVGLIKCQYCSLDGCYGHARCSKNSKIKTVILDKEYRYRSSVRCWWFRRLWCGQS